MDGDDYVDTSDPEERAELSEFFPIRITTSSPRAGIETPRKRRKVSDWLEYCLRHYGNVKFPDRSSKWPQLATYPEKNCIHRLSA